MPSQRGNTAWNKETGNMYKLFNLILKMLMYKRKWILKHAACHSIINYYDHLNLFIYLIIVRICF